MLTTLPVEVIKHIYESLDSFKTATSLARTSSFLHAILTDNKPTIFTHILPQDPILNRINSHYDRALALFHAQTPHPPPIPTLDAVKSIYRNALTVNRTASAISTTLAPGFDWSDRERRVFKYYSRSVLRCALYDLWTLLLERGVLVQTYWRGLPHELKHPNNGPGTVRLCCFLADPQWRRYGYPDVREVVPAGVRASEMGRSGESARRGLVVDLIQACEAAKNAEVFRAMRESQRRLGEVRRYFKVMTLEEQVAAMETIVELRKQVAGLQVEQTGLRKRMEAAEEGVEEMRRLWEEKFGHRAGGRCGES